MAAYGAIMYIAFIFAAILLGFASGSAPIISYQFGAQNQAELQSLFRKCLMIVGVMGISMTALAELAGPGFVWIFVGYDSELYAMTLRGLRLFSVSFLITGVTIFASSFFTALGDGAVSAVISFLRTLVFEIVCVLLLPRLLGLDGVWLAMAASELLTLGVSIYFWVSRRKKYGYA